MATSAAATDAPVPRAGRRGAAGPARALLYSRPAVWAIAAASAAAGATAGCHPTGTPVVDPLYAAVLAGLVTLAAGRAARGTVLWLAALAVAFSRHLLIAPAAAGLLVAFAATFARRRPPAAGALAAALAVQVVLRWPPTGFQGATAALAAVAVLPCLIGAWHGLPGRARRWVAAIVGVLAVLAVAFVAAVAAAGLAAHRQVSSGISYSQAALQTVSDGNARSAVQELDLAGTDFSAAADRLGAWWTAGARLVPVAAQQRQALAVATAVARDLARTAAEQASGIDYSQLRYSTGGIDLARLAALQPALTKVDTQLARAVGQLRSIRSGWLVQPVSSRLGLLDHQVTKASSSTSLALAAVRDAPALLGGDGTRHYFVAFLDTSESRGLGGIIASYAELTATGGHLSLTSSGDIGQLNAALAAAGGGHLSGPAQFLEMYGYSNPQNHFQDLSYPPDLPTVADVVSQLYAEAGRGRIDGVIVLDPRSLATLLKLTGPVNAGGLGQLSSANAEQVLTSTQYQDFPGASQQQARTAALQAGLNSAFEKLTGGSLPGPRSLGQLLGPVVRSGDLLFWSTHPRDLSLLNRLGLTGAFPSAGGGDLLSVVTQNVANNKIDAYLQRTITDRVFYDPGTGQTLERLQIQLHNEAPSSGLPAEVIGSYSGSGLPLGTNLTWLTVYSPLRLGSARVDGKLVGMGLTPQYGVNSYSDFIAVPAGQTVTVDLRLQGRLDQGSGYQLIWHHQPTVLPDQMSVTMAPSAGWAVDGPATWVAGVNRDSTHRFVLRRA